MYNTHEQLKMDSSEQKIRDFLSIHSPQLTLQNLKEFLPYTINLNPQLTKDIKDAVAEEDLAYRPEPLVNSLRSQQQFHPLQRSASTDLFIERAAPAATVSGKALPPRYGLSHRFSSNSLIFSNELVSGQARLDEGSGSEQDSAQL